MVFRSAVKDFHEYKCLSLIVLNYEHLRPRQRESIFMKTLMALKPRIFSPANLSPSTVSLVPMASNAGPNEILSNLNMFTAKVKKQCTDLMTH